MSSLQFTVYGLRLVKFIVTSSHRHIVTFLLLLFSCNSIFSQAKFYATAPKGCALNQNLQYNLTLENANGSNLKPPAFTDFQVISGPNTSTSMQWVNGNVTQSVTYSYIIRPKAEGTFKIGKGSIVVSGVTMESNEVSVTITQAVAQQKQQRQRNPFDPFDDPFFNPQQNDEPETSQEDLQKQLKDDVFIKLQVNKNSAYKGEMLTATYKLYFRQNLSGFNVTKAPAFDGFWSQEVALDPKRKQQVENVNGKQFYTVDIMKYNLYPQRDGNLNLPPVEVSTVAQVAVKSKSNGGFFDDFFNMGRAVQVPLKLNSNASAVNVKELPADGKPSDFYGAVGKYSYEASLSSKNAKTDEPITYSVKISGTGNLKFIDAPKLVLPESFEVYDPKVKENIANGAEGLSGSKQYDYLIIPRQPGEFKIESNSFSYFNPGDGKYSTLKSPEFMVKVTGEPSKNVNANNNTVAENKTEVNALGQDIRYIKTSAPEFKKQNSFFGSAGFVALYASPFFLFLGLIALKKRNESLAADIVGSKRRKALGVAKKRLSVAEKFLKQSDKKNFYTEVSLAIWDYLGNKLNMDMAELSKDNVEEKLLSKTVKPETISALKNLISTCEMALYSQIGEGGEMKHNYDTALNLIADLEDEIKDVKPKQEQPSYYSLSSLVLFVLLATASLAQKPNELFNAAGILYKQNEFARSSEVYEKILSQGYKTAEIYYNLGNCYFKQNILGKAILNYERAKKFSPADEDILHNLRYANAKATDKIQPVPQMGIISQWKNFTESHSANSWGIFALAFIWVSLVVFAVYLFVARKTSVAVLGSLFVVLSLSFLLLSFKQYSSEENSKEAIVMVNEIFVKSAPDNSSTNIFQLHEGTKLQLLDNVGNWYKIRIADGKVGWLESNNFSGI